MRLVGLVVSSGLALVGFSGLASVASVVSSGLALVGLVRCV